jgi:dTDP-D-glucose 4,6-dehydratase
MRMLVTGGCGFIGTTYPIYFTTLQPASVSNVDVLTYAGNLAIWLVSGGTWRAL